MTDPGAELAVLAAVVTRQSADLAVYADFLTTALADSLPAEQITVERRRRRFGRDRDDAPVLAVTVHLGDREYSLRRDGPGAPAHAGVAHVVNGIVLSTRSETVSQWAQEVAAALTDLARSNADTAAVLARMTNFTV